MMLRNRHTLYLDSKRNNRLIAFLARASKPKTTPPDVRPICTDLREGDGKFIKPRSVFRCHYEGRLRDGNQIFDTSRGKEPFVFMLGEGQVIKGWEMGLIAPSSDDGKLMKEGGIRRLVIPPELAYGERGVRDPKDPQRYIIPPGSTLEFEIESLPTDGSLFRIQREASQLKEKASWLIGELLRGPG